MPLEFSVWPAGSIEKYRQLARNIADSDGTLGPEQIARLADVARRTDLAGIAGIELERFIEIVLTQEELVVVPRDSSGPEDFAKRYGLELLENLRRLWLDVPAFATGSTTDGMTRWLHFWDTEWNE